MRKKKHEKRGKVGEVLQAEEKLQFILRGGWILSNAFSALFEMVCFSACILSMWCTTLIDFCMSGSAC